MDKNYIIKVKRELTNIKKYATVEELNNLNFYDLNPLDHRFCIYGQLTDSCYNERATELIKLCCNTKTSFEGVDKYSKLITEKPRFLNQGHTYVEHFIIHHKEYNQHIVDFLKGETDKLIIKLVK